MDQAYRVHVQISEDGALTLSGLPFRAGEDVEVIVLAEAPQAGQESRYPLRGQPLRYDQPTAPVAQSDWQALQ